MVAMPVVIPRHGGTDNHLVVAKPGVHGAAQNTQLEEELKKNGGLPLPISFDIHDQKTFRPVGGNANQFTNLIGTCVKRVPFYYARWDQVPDNFKDDLWATLRTYYNLQPYLNLPQGNNVRKAVEDGIDSLAAERYKKIKAVFKKRWYTDAEGDLDTIRMHPPPKMDLDVWGRHVDFFSGKRSQHVAEVNQENRGQMKYITTQGRRSFARRRHDAREQTGQFPPLIDFFADTHKSAGTYVNQLAQQQHEDMQALWDANQLSDEPLSEGQILDKVLGVRPGHRRGRGRIVKNTQYKWELNEDEPNFQLSPSDFVFDDDDDGEGGGECSMAQDDSSDEDIGGV